ncbi:OsmC family protein [Bacillus sp. S/N-304-OC-R1]|uniref:OsmC family protein n=1 Tax=Bacillus sp. S/N-304-OC-R1 TaxID=2758034 RepID=UPI001C8DF45C|nr:OsmC family protein [Bacillus sp. S/N-304-OC-R1]MBY0122833.1 OsmC family protein [Bacillus sp. S/N-304-OC-R1]
MRYTIEKESIIANLGFGNIQISPNEKIGFRSYELFISSLAGCSGTLLRNILQKKRQVYEKIEMEVSSVRNPDEANRIEKISITAYVQLQISITQQQADKIAHLVIKNCGMIQSVIQSIDITFTIEILPLNGE